MKKAYKKHVPHQQPLPTSAANPSNVTVLVDSQLQYDMVAETPLSQVDGAVTGAFNKDGSSQVFYMSSSDVMCAYQSKDAAETWVVENTRIPSGSKPAAISASKDGTRLFMVDKSQTLYVLDMRKRFPIWSSLGTIPNSETLLDLRALKDANKNTIAIVISTTGNFHNAYQVDLNGTWTQDKIFSANMGGSVYDVQVSAAYGDESVSSSWGYYMSGRIGFNEPAQDGLVTLNSMASWGERRLIALGTFNSIASLPTDIPGFSYFFAVDANKHVQYFKPNGNSFTPVSIAPDVTASSVVVGRRVDVHASGLMQIPEVMILSTSGVVYHVSPATYSKSGGQEVSVDSWTAPAQIASSVTNIVVEQEAKQVPSYFLSTSNAQLMFVTLSASTGEWVKQQVELPPANNTTATTQEVYYLNIRVLNANTEPVPGGSATISVDGYALMQVNGRQYRVDANRPLVTSLSRIGQLSVTAICNKKISTPVFSVHVSGMDAEDVMDVNPAGSIQLKFKNATPEFLLNATNQITGKQTIQGDYRDPAVIKAVSDALNKSGAISAALHETSIEHRKYLHPSVKTEVARVRRRTNHPMNKINVAKLAEGGFRLSFAHTPDSKPHLQYETLTAEQGVALVEAWKTESSKFGVSWGDITEGIANAWYTVTDFVINTVGGAIVASIRLLVGAVEKLWEGVVYFANQVLDLAQMVFDKIKVFFEDVFAWLGFLFDWDDIKATQKVLKDKLVGFTDTMNTLVNTWLPKATASAVDVVRQLILQSFSQLESTLGGTTWSTWDHQGTTPRGMLGDDSITLDHLPSSAWWFIDKALGGFTGGFGGFDFGSAIDAVLASFEAVKGSITSQTTRKDWQDFMDSLSNLGNTLTSRAVLDKSTIISLLKVLKSGILLLLDGVAALVAGFTSLVSSLVSFWSKIILAPLNIPILSPIYKAITGDELSTINFCTLLFAIPITLGYKLLYNAAPFPASVRSKALAANALSVKAHVVLLRCAAVVKFVATFFDISIDFSTITADEAPLWQRIVNNLVAPIISSALTFDYRHSFTKVTEVQALSYGAWGAGLAPILLNLGAMAISRGHKDMGSTPELAGVLAFTGVGMTGVGIAFTIMQIIHHEYEWQSSADTICDPLPLCFKWLVFSKNEYAGALLILLDVCTSFVVILARGTGE